MLMNEVQNVLDGVRLAIARAERGGNGIVRVPIHDLRLLVELAEREACDARR